MQLDGAAARALRAWFSPLVSRTSRRCVVRYTAAAGVGHLVWETLQIPFYTLWDAASLNEIVADILICTGNDVAISASALLLAVLLTGRTEWPRDQYIRVAVMTVLLGLCYTAISELVNVYVDASWGYSEYMLRVPGIHVGLSPILQWIVVPIFSFYVARPRLADREEQL
jgi:hypothetical protein